MSTQSRQLVKKNESILTLGFYNEMNHNTIRSIVLFV